MEITFFVNIMEFEPALPGEKDYEAHKIYADIHVVISGTESIAVAPLEQCVLKVNLILTLILVLIPILEKRHGLPCTLVIFW